MMSCLHDYVPDPKGSEQMRRNQVGGVVRTNWVVKNPSKI